MKALKAFWAWLIRFPPYDGGWYVSPLEVEAQAQLERLRQSRRDSR